MIVDFAIPENKSALLTALDEVRRQFGREYDLAIGDRRLLTESKIVSVNPARPSEVIGVHQRAAADESSRGRNLVTNCRSFR